MIGICFSRTKSRRNENDTLRNPNSSDMLLESAESVSSRKIRNI